MATPTPKEDISTSTAAISTLNPPTSNTTMASLTALHQKRMFAPKNASCTHITMTRLYSKEFRCANCHQIPPNGFLYRCTQDRELLIEDDFEKGYGDKFDSVSAIFPRPSAPRKRGPAARSSVMSFFEETSDEAMKGYTEAQLAQIQSQRARVLEIATRDSESSNSEETFFSNFYADGNSSSPSPNNSSSPSRISTKSQRKPWLPARGSECQFKSCSRCRPTLVERTFLSLDGIANDDIPFTAITGFGFHLRKQRPVALVEKIKNIGLRPSAPPREISPEEIRMAKEFPQHFYNIPPPTGMGLGLISSTSNMPIIPRPLPVPRPLPEPPISPNHQAERTLDDTASPNWSFAPISRTPDFELAILTPLPFQSPEELTLISGPLTPMEEDELGGTFGREPLEVADGIALMEEAVRLHVADLITQF